MDDLISRRAAIGVLHEALDRVDQIADVPFGVYQNYRDKMNELPPAQPNIMYIIMETLAECGIYGEEATIKLIGTLKRIGRDDLIPPCAR